MATPIRFLNETPECRAVREELLEAERELRRRTAQVAALRRRLPPGGRVPVDYVFDESAGKGGQLPHDERVHEARRRLAPVAVRLLGRIRPWSRPGSTDQL